MHESRGYRQRLARFQVNSIEHERCQDRGVPGKILVELDGGASELSAELCASDRAILDLEESWQAGSLSVDKETAIRDSLGLSSPRYHLRLNELIDDEKAAQYAPSLVGRLQRVRSQQRRSRSAQLLR